MTADSEKIAILKPIIRDLKERAETFWGSDTGVVSKGWLLEKLDRLTDVLDQEE